MVTRGLTIYEFRSFGRHIWIFRLRQIRSRYVWHYSKFHDLLRRQVIEDVTDTWTVVPISHLLESSQQPTQLGSMPIRANHDTKIWCDICKIRYGKVGAEWHTRAMTPARWIVISETKERRGRTKAYCQPCANECQVDGQGKVWTFREQLDYALGREQLDGMESQ